MKLALGTAQFGAAYGVAGRGEAVPEREVRSILAHAVSHGVDLLDSAPVYGDVEARLAALLGDLPASVVSKIAPLPPALTDPRRAAEFVAASVRRSIDRLGSRLTAVLFHRAEDLQGTHSDAIWQAAQEAAGNAVRLGVSCYDPSTLVALRRTYPIDLVQLPGNVLDQRLMAADIASSFAGVEIHLRSVFLQGLLLMPEQEAIRRVPAAALPLARWRAWCARRGVTPLAAALGVARTLPRVSALVVGVDRLEQLQEILAAWNEGGCAAPDLACESLDVIDPRRWASVTSANGVGMTLERKR